MAIPISYSWRSLFTRRLTSALTAGGMALVVFVFAAVLMLAAGLKATLVATGSPDNVIVIRAGSESEIQSGVDRDQAAVISTDPAIALGQDGEPLVTKEVAVVVGLPKRAAGEAGMVSVRGVGRASLALRPQVHISAGRYLRAGAAEVVVGSGIAKRFQHTGLGELVHIGLREWRVVGIMEAGNTGFSSEIWGDNNLVMQAFQRPVYSSVTFRLKDAGQLSQVKQRLEHDPRLTVEAFDEVTYYAKQSEMMARFIGLLGLVLTIIFSAGATIGAMITMYAAVANRTREIGTLRALGFNRRSILAAFLAESLLLAASGATAGLLCASLMQFLTISTTNWQTFSELAFRFTLTPTITLYSLLFALAMGLAGGVLPALRAARLNIVDALRAA